MGVTGKGALLTAATELRSRGLRLLPCTPSSCTAQPSWSLLWQRKCTPQRCSRSSLCYSSGYPGEDDRVPVYALHSEIGTSKTV